MARKEIVIVSCDVCGSEKDVIPFDDHVMFLTEQTEGRTCKPYLEKHRLDLCSCCIDKLMNERKRITARGAQGFNEYSISNSKRKDV